MIIATLVSALVLLTAAATGQGGAACDRILSQGFDGHTATTGYTLSAMRADWPGSDGPAKMLDETASGAASPRVKDGALYGYFPEGKILGKSGGFSWFTELEPMESATMSYDVYFEAGFDFTRGGKLPGLAGHDAPRGCSTVNDTRGWSHRLMWQENGGMVTYAYYPSKSRAIRCGENWKWSAGVVAGRWHNIRMYVGINTAGVPNGVSKAWLDGKLVLDKRDVMYRAVDRPEYTVTKAYMTTYVGGSSVEMFAPDHDQWIKFDNFNIWRGSCSPAIPAEVYTKFEGVDQPLAGDIGTVAMGHHGVPECRRRCEGTPGCDMFTVYNGTCYLKRFVSAPVRRAACTLYARGCGKAGGRCCFGTSCEGSLSCASGTCVDVNADVAVQSSCGVRGGACCGFYKDCDEDLQCLGGICLGESPPP